MVDVWLPYGKTEVCARIPARNFFGSIEPKEKAGVQDSETEIERALREPIGSKRIDEIVKPEHKVAIVIDDSTRKTPSKLMLKPVISELNKAGVKDENILIIFGCGTHREVTHDEAVKIIGPELIDRIKTISHRCKDENLVYVGTTKSHGNKIYLNREFTEADIRILLGDVGFHYYAGYGGGRKSVIPAVAGEETIKNNHALLLSSNAKTGVLEQNPVNEDMIEGARMAKVDFIVNIVTNSKGEVVRAFAGDMEKAFEKAVELVDEMYRVSVDRRADIVVVSCGGAPSDINLFQAYKAVDGALDVVKRGGVIVLVAECLEGHGNQVFYDWMVRHGELKPVEREIKRNFQLGGHKAYYLLKALQNHTIILVSSLPDYYATNIFKMKTARAVNEAMNEAFSIAGSSARVWAITHGHSILPQYKAVE